MSLRNSKTSMNLLIIEDDEICSYINMRVAQTSGLFQEIKSVRNGQEALDFFEGVCNEDASAPDIILLDLNMPLMNGFDFIERLKALDFPRKERMHIVVLTSSDSSFDIDRARAMGIKHYLVKSLTQKDLQDTIFSLSSEQSVDR